VSAVGTFIKELKYNLRSIWTVILFALSSVLTFVEGMQYAGRGEVTPPAAELGLTTMAQEWAHRTTFAAVGLPLLAVTVAVWFQGSRDRRYHFSSLVQVRPVRSGRLMASRLVSAVCGVLVPHLGGVTAGVVLVGLVQALWPDFGLFIQSTVLNLMPGFLAWVALVYMLTSVVPDLKVWIFPVIILWLFLINVPSTSLFWFYRSIASPMHPAADPLVWRRVVYCILVTGLSYALLLWSWERQRAGHSLFHFRTHRTRGFRVVQDPVTGRLKLALKITLGSKLYVALLGVTGLAVFLASPFGILQNQPLYVREYFSLAFPELLFPLIGLLVTYSFVADRHSIAEIIYQRPGGEGKALEQRLVGLGTYLLSTCLVYALWLHIFIPSVPLTRILGVLFPSMLILSGLSIAIGAFSRSPFWAYAVSLAYWGAAYQLQEKFPWFLSPVYQLAEYTFKLRQDLLWKNKIILLVAGTAAMGLGLWKTLRNPVKRHE
jgi:hypothetical protein